MADARQDVSPRIAIDAMGGDIGPAVIVGGMARALRKDKSLHFDLFGEGRALLFRDGAVWEATWRREGENVLARVVGADGQPIPIDFGQTWVQIVPDDMAVTWE